MKSFTIRQDSLSFKIGNYLEPFIIAEIGVNHNGSIENAKKLIELSKLAGANAVKFQNFSSEELVLPNTKKAKYQIKNTNKLQNQKDMLKELELKFSDFLELKKFAKTKKIFFSTTPYNFKDIEMLKGLNLPFLKAASIHCGEPYFLKLLSELNVPVFLSTGLSNLNQVKKGAKILQKKLKNKYVILQCTSDYPISIEEANINVLEEYKNLNFIYGFSDHSENNTAALLALSKGACVFEKHITLDKNDKGPDHFASLTPNEFKEYVVTIKQGYSALGSFKKDLTKSEKINYEQMKRSVYLNKDLKKFHKVTREDINIMRPYNKKSDVELLEKFIGMKVIKDVKKHTLLSKDILSD